MAQLLPRLDVLVNALLSLESLGDDDDWPVWKDFLKQYREKRLRGLADACGTAADRRVAGYRWAVLQRPLHGTDELRR